MAPEPDEQGTASTEPGQASDTATVAPAPAAPVAPTAEVKPPGPDASGGVFPVAASPGDTPGKPVGDSAPTLTELQNQLCPNCKTGVLYVVRYDPEALHEKGQDIWVQNQPRALPEGFESGGAYEVECRQCAWTASFAMNPGENHGTARA